MALIGSVLYQTNRNVGNFPNAPISELTLGKAMAVRNSRSCTNRIGKLRTIQENLTALGFAIDYGKLV